ncbi:MAG TPA: glucuronate isomerase [Candidatus Faecousia faecipullorum]|nr:glucuronate isomerase [Candidatus Faecousia faecipullorum]
MKPFMNEDFLLGTETARKLYHDHAEKMPIIDYHCHINPMEIYEDKRYDTITEVWLGGDHYKWRAMRSCGVPERYITGDATPAEKFQKWAETIPSLIGNPLYHWTHLELQRYFGITEPLTGDNAMEIYETCNRILAQPDMSVRGIIRKSGVKLICTTDDPVDDLKAHELLAADPTAPAVVLPAFRPDKAMRADKPTFPQYVSQLEAVVGYAINTVEDMRRALADRIAYFADHGCRVSDHALDYCFCEEATEEELNDIFARAKAGKGITWGEQLKYHTALLIAVGKEYSRRDWVVQFHFGCLRDNSRVNFRKLGPDTGFDSMNDAPNAAGLARLLGTLEEQNALGKTILYSLNPSDNGIVGSIMGAFQTDSPIPGKIQQGSAWWFNDHKPGMEAQMVSLMSLGAMGSFNGMLTDSRSFLSYTRHEYFRRILCNLFGNLVENGEYPADMERLGKMVENISYNNTLHYFRFDELLK